MFLAEKAEKAEIDDLKEKVTLIEYEIKANNCFKSRQENALR